MNSSFMKRFHILIAALMLVPSVSRAQQETVDVGNDIRGRFSVEIDRKLAKGLHVFAEGEEVTEDAGPLVACKAYMEGSVFVRKLSFVFFYSFVFSKVCS